MKYIYRYRCLINGKSYIGQTVDFKKRLREHKNAAFNKNNSDFNFMIHRAIRKYNLENFEISILEICQDEEADKREIYWISFYDSYQNGYNMTPGGQRGALLSGRPVLGYDLDGNFIKKWASAKECSNELGVSYSVIQQVLHQERPTCKKFQLKYENDSREISKFISNQGGGLRVDQLDKKGNFLNSFKSIAEAARQTGCDSSTITKVLKGKLKTTGGYQWRYSEGVEGRKPYEICGFNKK